MFVDETGSVDTAAAAAAVDEVRDGSARAFAGEREVCGKENECDEKTLFSDILESGLAERAPVGSFL